MPRESATITAIEHSAHTMTVKFSDGSSACYAVNGPAGLHAVEAPPPTVEAQPARPGARSKKTARATTIAPPAPRRSTARIIGQGEMAERIRSYPWSESPLGDIETWPEALVAHVNLILGSPQALAIYWGPEMIFLGNDESVRLIGPRIVHALGLPARELWGDHWDQMESRLHTVLSSGVSISGRSELFRFSRIGKPDESFIDFCLSPIYDGDRVAGVFRTLHDTTETVLAMRALAESNDRLQMALSGGTGFGVWDWHIQTGTVYCDATIARLYDLDPAEAARGVSHLQLQRMLHPDDIVILTDGIMECILTGKELNVEYRVRRPDGSCGWVQSMGRCLFDDEGHAYRVTGLKTDVTERRMREAAAAAKPSSRLWSGDSWDGLPAPIRTFLEATFSFLTEHPEDITLEILPDGDESRIVVRAGEENLGKLIGKQGRTIRSVRTLLLAVCASSNRRFTIEVERGRRAPGSQPEDPSPADL